MATVRRFEDLECWQGAREFVRLIYGITRNDRFRTDYELVGQIKRSAISAMANIAEGFHRTSARDFMKFLDYSRAFIAETVSHCYVAPDQKYINQPEIVEVNEQANLVWKKVNNFISYLNKTSKLNQNSKGNQ